MTEHWFRERREREGIIFFIFMFIIIITIINTLTRERREREGSKERLEADSRAVMVWVFGLWVMTWSSLRGSYGLSPLFLFQSLPESWLRFQSCLDSFLSISESWSRLSFSLFSNSPCSQCHKQPQSSLFVLLMVLMPHYHYCQHHFKTALIHMS